jgi:hypothetical protein
VSCRRKTTSPERTFFLFAWAISSSMSLSPRASVRRKDSSSCLVASRTKASFSSSSGVGLPHLRHHDLHHLVEERLLQPQPEPWRMARRMIRRST